MSLQYGFWSFANKEIAPDIAKPRSALAAFEADSVSEYHDHDNGVHLIYLPFWTTPESETEKQPYVTRSWGVVLWDGRLDNRRELIDSLGSELSSSADVAIVAAALEKWGTNALPKFIGDWALSVWNPRERSVLLAKDFLGTRHLYYVLGEKGFAWSTVINPLLPFLPGALKLEEEYLAGWFTYFPSTNLTPFVGIHSVPPSSYLFFCGSKTVVRRYWDFDPAKTVSYRDDRDYEEHLRTVFRESVRRRLRSRRPVLAELSGGMDSSSIVCMADALSSGGFCDSPRLDTISYFDETEPNWNEAPFFERVEQQRGRAGRHIVLDFKKRWCPQFDPHFLAATPDSGNQDNEYVSYVRSGGYRVLLQGVGGDEVLGGVPTPLPELADLLTRAKLGGFFHQLLLWAIANKITAFRLAIDTIRQFLPARGKHEREPWPAWLTTRFSKANARALAGYPRRFCVFAPLPSFQANLAALESLRRQIACVGLSPSLPVERRYPYLDRDLLEFLYAIPREQLVRPSQRRSLMRRALVGIVPPEILNRKRKAFIARAPLISIQTELPHLLERTRSMASSRLDIVNAETLRQALINAAGGGELQIVATLRTLLLEAWVSHLDRCARDSEQGLLPPRATAHRRHITHAQVSSAEENPIERR